MQTTYLNAAWAVVATLVLAVGIGPTASAQSTTESKLWGLIKDGRAFAIMRHALAPGTGDPSSFRIGDCSTQRNLNNTGRAQARAIGARFKANGIARAEVLTSQWCRCRETARLLDIGTPSDLPAINSFFQEMNRREAQTDELKTWLKANAQSGARVLVTHQVNISALTGEFTRSGEIIVATLEPGGTVTVHGSLMPE